ncbi:MAG: AraC family transcriptional regulator [Alphaproteobacteria bacterium]|nr:AraC family transcriptional regulator [Alphaproteobacteria bacterium]
MTHATGNSGEGPTPRFENGRAMLIAGLGGRYGNENRAEIPMLWQHFGPRYFGRTPGQVDRKTYGVCSNFDAAGSLDYLAGVEVSSFEDLPAELTQLRIGPHRYAIFAHGGHISAIGRTWMDIFEKWLPKSGYELAAAPSFECYGEAFDPEVAIGNVEIWLAIDSRTP